MKLLIATKESIYEFEGEETFKGRLRGGRIKEEDGVNGFFATPLEVGKRPVFISLEKCTLEHGLNEEETTPEISGIQLATIEKIEVQCEIKE